VISSLTLQRPTGRKFSNKIIKVNVGQPHRTKFESDLFPSYKRIEAALQTAGTSLRE